MRVQRHKAARKALGFYRLAFGITPPYKVLLDGNFIAHAVRMSIDFRRLLPKLLHAEEGTLGHGPTAPRVGVYLHVTDCCLEELRSLGAKGAPVVAAATGGAVGVIRCRHKHGHAEGTDASECLRLLVGPGNVPKFVVATQDAGLREAMRRVPGTPLVLFSQNVMVLEGPSDASKKHQAGKEAAKAAVQPSELAAIARTLALGSSSSSSSSGGAVGVKRKREADGETSDRDNEDDDAGGGGEHAGAAAAGQRGGRPESSSRPAKAAKPPSSLPALLASAGISSTGKPHGLRPKRKRKQSGGPSGPNPLSMRKKQGGGPPPAGRGGDGSSSAQPRRKRRHAAETGGAEQPSS